jgi:hypothetical protein
MDERLIVERQFSGGWHAYNLDSCIGGEDNGGVLAAVVNAELSANVRFTEWS